MVNKLKNDIYCLPHLIQEEFKRMEKDDRIIDANKGHITKFTNAQRLLGKSTARIHIYVSHLRLVARYFRKDFKEISRDEVIQSLNELKKEGTLNQLKVATFKTFMRWLLDGSYDTIVGEGRRCIVKADKSKRQLTNEDLLTLPEIQKMVDWSHSTRNKCVLSLLYDVGCRIGELASIEIKDVVFDKQGATVRLTGNTGTRSSRVVWALPHLKAWLEIHPYRNNPNSPLFVSIQSDVDKPVVIQYQVFIKIIKDAAKATGLKKRIHPHLFRHSRATHLIVAKVPKEAITTYMGWNKDSDMLSVYSHLSPKDVDGYIQNSYGGKVKQEEAPQARLCPRCQVENSLISDFCSKCGALLNESVAVTQPFNEEKKLRELVAELGITIAEVVIKNPKNKDRIPELIRKRIVFSTAKDTLLGEKS